MYPSKIPYRPCTRECIPTDAVYRPLITVQREFRAIPSSLIPRYTRYRAICPIAARSSARPNLRAVGARIIRR